MRAATAANSDWRESSISSREETLVSRHREPVRSSAPTLSERSAELESSGSFADGRVSSVDDDPAEWCVDHGDAMSVMSLVELWIAITQGEVAPDARVWREGMECWTRVDAMPELQCALAGDEAVLDLEDSIEQSGPIPLVRPRAELEEEPAPPLRSTLEWPGSAALLVVAGLTIASGIGDSQPPIAETAPDPSPPSEASSSSEAPVASGTFRRVGSSTAGQRRAGRASSAR
jgi:hypothetical protein